MSKKIKVIHIGKKAETIHHLLDKYEYMWIPLSYDFLQDSEKICFFIKGNYNPELGQVIFVIEKYAKILTQAILFKQLPTHRVIYSENIELNLELEKVFSLKGAIPRAIQPFSEIEKFINEHYTSRQQGYKLNSDYMEVSPLFQGEIHRNGHSYIELK